MKKLYILFFSIFIASLNAQIVNIPDANFKSKLLEANTTNGIAKDIDGNNIVIDVNDDNEIQTSEALLVYELFVMGLENSPDSQIIDITGIESFENLSVLNCNVNKITELNISNLTNLEALVCGKNQISELNVSALSNLEFLFCDFNFLTNIDLSNLSNLNYLSLANNSLTSLDCSLNPNLEFIRLPYNQLTFLNLKNGTSLDYEEFQNEGAMDAFDELGENVNICLDDFEIELIEPFLYNNYNWNLNSYCSTEPESIYNSILGNVKFDYNSDGNCDDFNEFSLVKLNLSNGTQNSYTYANTLGEFQFFTEIGNYQLSPEITENPGFFTISPENADLNFPTLDGSTQTQNFCISPNGIHPDVEIIVTPVDPARPGFEATYKIVYRNKGNQTVSGTIDFNFNDDLMNFNSSSPTQNSQSEGLLSYNFSDLNPFETRTVYLSFDINAPTETPPVNIGDILPFSSEINIAEDEIPNDNIFELNQEVIGSYDPNDIICLQGESVSPEMIGEELHYRIRFENTGNYPAERVVVAMPVNIEDYEVSSFQLLNTSHEVQARIVNNTAEFFFEEIDLEPNEQGDILFSIKSLDSLETGDSVISYADIYFDYNYPVTTNEAVTTFELLSTNEVEENSISIYPNPAQNEFNIQSENKINSIEIYDVSGRLIQVSKLNSNQSKQDISKLQVGIYLLKIHTEEGMISYKLIKK